MNVGIIGSGDVGLKLADGLIEHGHSVKVGTRDITKKQVVEWASKHTREGGSASVGRWFTDFVRSQIYARSTFPHLRVKAESLWKSGSRQTNLLHVDDFPRGGAKPPNVCWRACWTRMRTTGIPAKIFFGTYEVADEQIVTTYLKRHAEGLDITVTFVRQTVPGKRVSIGLALRAMSRYGVTNDDLVLFMDGDTYLDPGMLRKCLPRLRAVSGDGRPHHRRTIDSARSQLDAILARHAQCATAFDDAVDRAVGESFDVDGVLLVFPCP